MYLQVSWSAESSYETPDVSGPYASLQEIVERYGSDEIDNREDDTTLYYERLLQGEETTYGTRWDEVSDETIETLRRLQEAL